MSHHRRAGLLLGGLLLAISAAACASSAAAGGATQAGVDPATRFGTYRFSERVPETSPQNLVLEGTVTITADTADFDMVPGPCRYAQPSQQSRTAWRYQCGDVAISIDREDPTRINYSLTAIVAVSRNVCVARDANGNCLQFEVQKEEVPQRRSGRLRLIKVS